jgi:hypothetical protein
MKSLFILAPPPTYEVDQTGALEDAPIAGSVNRISDTFLLGAGTGTGIGREPSCHLSQA